MTNEPPAACAENGCVNWAKNGSTRSSTFPDNMPAFTSSVTTIPILGIINTALRLAECSSVGKVHACQYPTVPPTSMVPRLRISRASGDVAADSAQENGAIHPLETASSEIRNPSRRENDAVG